MGYIPLIKKNLIQVKRHLIVTIFQLLYPCIVIGIVILLINFKEKNYIPETTYYNYMYDLSLNDNIYKSTFR